jgi:ApbE superfamily uncharacterized protein (UPF0280 family)
MFAERPTLQWLAGERLHLQHGPIDVVLKAWAEPPALACAYEAAAERFPALLGELVAELGELRKPVGMVRAMRGAVARRMADACAPFAPVFITPMAAVAGAVADELLAAMTAVAPLARAFVNNGGDIAVHLRPGEALDIGVAGDMSCGRLPAASGRIRIAYGHGIGGVATSGWGGRSFSLGIADSVTVLSASAAAADAAATLIANAVSIDSPAIRRKPACVLDPDSDLGERLVTTHVGPLTIAEITAALDSGCRLAEDYRASGLIVAAALTLQGETLTIGDGLAPRHAQQAEEGPP